MQVKNEEQFSIPTEGFIISPSSSGYTLAYSADGQSFTDYSEPTPANEVCIVRSGVKHVVYKLVGNADTVYINY